MKNDMANIGGPVGGRFAALVVLALLAVTIVTGSGAVGLAIGLTTALWTAGHAVVGPMMADYLALSRMASEYRLKAGRLFADELVDRLTHDVFRVAREALDDASGRVAARGPIARAQAGIAAVERALRETRASRERVDGDRAPLLVGGVAQALGPDSGVMRLYGDPLALPGWLPAPLQRVLLHVGRVLDDVRLLHNLQIEWSVLLFTLWARALLVCFAPTLAALSLAPVPLAGGSAEPGDAVWALAAAWAVVCALQAPRVARAALDRTPEAARTRRWLLVVEVPLACALAVCAPSWMAVAFAAGWTNWWQRQWNDPLEPAEFSWLRLAVFVAATVTAQATGLAVAGEPVGDAAVEIAIALAAIGVIGGSYGAILPVSASVLAQSVGGAIVCCPREGRTASRRIERSIGELLAAADAIDSERAPGDGAARQDAVALRDVARQLRLREDLRERAIGKAQSRLESLLGEALRSAGTMADSTAARRLVTEAAARGEEEPVTFSDPSISPRAFRDAKVTSRKVARTLRRLVMRCATEARAHGAGPLETIVRVADGRVVLRFANGLRATPAPVGRGSGGHELRTLAEALPGGELRHRGAVDSRFVEGAGRYDVYGVEVAFDQGALEIEEGAGER
jgi:hypothetical protein